jgi:cyclophilin family peptidyl-prolyl cis-trans isomerase
MTSWAMRRIWAVRQLGFAGVLLTTAMAGCYQQPSGGDDAELGATLSAEPETEPLSKPTEPAVDAIVPPVRLDQSFAEATRSHPPADWQRPPDVTMTGKSVGKLYTQVVAAWDGIRFRSADGRQIFYVATLDTELGPIEIALLPELAPNHVRNFLALAKVGYYDGLVFERTVHARSEGQPDLELIEGGCPLGTGEIGHGSIGYWLKPEFSAEPHVEGTVGACHGEETDTAACKFYITLGKAPFLDNNFTVFGKVTQGLDVARKIFALPVRNDPEYPEGDRPEKPVVIRKITVVAREVAGPAVVGDNR